MLAKDVVRCNTICLYVVYIYCVCVSACICMYMCVDVCVFVVNWSTAVCIFELLTIVVMIYSEW